MKTLFIILVSVLFVSNSNPHKTGMNSGESQSQTSKIKEIYMPDSALIKGNNQFALDLYMQLKNTTGNIFYCPFSISAALAMTYGGARSATEKQMAEVAHFNQNQEEFHSDYSEYLNLIKSLTAKDSVEIYLANSIWAQKDFSFQKEFFDLVEQKYGAELTSVDFKNKLEKSRQLINKWVKKNTMGKIENLLKPGVLTTLTRMVLVNAIYFNGTWEKQFVKEKNVSGDFFTDNDTKSLAEFMTMEDRFFYSETDELQVIDIPYRGRKFSMLIFLPREINGIQSLDKAFNIENYTLWTGLMFQKKVNLSLPKFKSTGEFELSEPLQKMGMNDAFSENADFSGMRMQKDLMIDKVVHKTYIDVNESGTEAAASTAVVIIEKSGMVSPPVIFKADHPFIYVIRENTSGSILFVGRMISLSK